MDNLTPDATTKQSTVGSLLAGAKSSLSNLFVTNSTSSASSLTGSSSSTASSLLTSPFVWVGILITGVVVYFAKFKKTGRKSVTFRKR